ncbi:MAG: EamA family transporter [Candidatus Dactylopiibacterium carminicum]|uniref:EamA family transporter n=1 Tax=Candidatus Dactylopiibacterium carminicum TaxID=857335 RepID=A0A272ENJ0_9RHOO|nr:DMT family transporter [Candidatus Dactylopiibacterium carminicum]KAF7600700.1 EamA/RhaT family transporter [Candidatus Dactylopiibacterium carminicum]PAS91669.1 MAG: EamA family transporter [Candidatus Dactylopiibacterium carminicum]PAT00700.1 MAG: EamA family transporter [Candidatus Dactylopiibacterium carminicum]
MSSSPAAAGQKADWAGIAMLTLPPLFWAGNFIVGRAMRDTVPPLALSFDRWVIAFCCLSPFAWRAMLRDLPRYREFFWRLLGLAATGVAAFNVLVYFGLQSTSAANGMMLNSFIPLLIAGIGALFYRQRLTPAQIAGFIVSFFGVTLIVSHGDPRTLASQGLSQGDALVFIATVCWAFYTLWLRQIPAEIDRLGLMLAQIVIALVLLAPLLAWEMASGRHVVWGTNSLLAIAYVGVFPSVLAFVLYGAGVMRVGAARAGLFIHLLPVFGTLLSVTLLREPLHGYQLFGMGAILAGVAWANRPAGR